MRVIVDGVAYAPAAETTTSFGVAITTHNRPAQLEKTLAEWRRHTPSGTPIFVIDDASTTPPESDFRFAENVGIATAKNKSLELLMAADVEHLFLADDDCYPLKEGWWTPYIQSPEPHLFAVFPSPTPKSSRIEAVYQDSDHVAWHATRGYFLYFHRSVIDRIGGFDTRFRNAFEHVELSNRIYSAGLTSWPYQDVTGSDQLIFCEDSRPHNKSAIKDSERPANEELGRKLLAECAGRTCFVPYATDSAVLSCLFTGQPDPQRGKAMKPDPNLAAPLLNSIDATVLCDFPTNHPRFVQVDASENPYIQRWISYRQYLIANPQIRWVWCVDATDVSSLRDPFPGMQAGVLYAGWENQVVGCDWMVKNHAASRAWIEANADLPLLNAGVVGGDRDTILTFIGRLLQLWVDAKVSRRSDAAGDMGFFNQAARSMSVVTGPRITTLFKANQTNDFSLWKHK